MIRIIFLTAFRSLLRYKHITVINFFGLTLGLTSFLFISHYLVYEFSFDSFFEKPENVYRVNIRIHKDGNVIYNGAKTPRALYYAIRNEMPEMEANGIAYFEKCLVNYEDINIANQDFLWVDDGFEKVFPLEMLVGEADFSRPRTGAISETSAKAIFGDENPVGRIIGVNQGMPIEITGVFRDLPSNTHLTARYFASIKTWVEMEAISEVGDWRWNGWWNYVRVRDGVKAEDVENNLNSFVDRYMGFLDEDDREARFSLQPLGDLHFISGIEGEMGAVTSYASLVNLILVAVITLLIAWINYVSLASAHAHARSDRIRMRKLIGATNMHLWHQSLAESLMINLLAAVTAVVLYYLLLGIFAGEFNLPIMLADIPTVWVFVILVTTMLAGVLFSSAYQGFELSGIKLLSGAGKRGKEGYKNWLVMLQITFAIVFLISTFTVYKQIAGMKNTDLGIELDNVVICTGPASLQADPYKRQRYENFRNEILSLRGIESATFMQFVPVEEPQYGYREMNNPSLGVAPDVLFFVNNADNGFIATYRMNLLAGTDFSDITGSNRDKILINESGIRELGFDSPVEAVGSQVYIRGSSGTPLEIIGVIGDFHNEGLQKPIYPMVWNNNYPPEFGYIVVRIAGDTPEVMNTLSEVWRRHYPNDDAGFVFADDYFNRQYESESRFGKFYLWLTILSIGIASMGMYGLVLFQLDKRRREIGIRKVNGAGPGDILIMLNMDFLKLVGISFLVAIPVAWYVMDSWLQNFAYRTGMSWWIFALAGLLAMVIALLTVSWQSWRAANRNPVEALRYE